MCLLAESSAQVNVWLEVDNPLQVLVNTSAVYLRWNYSIVGDDELRDLEFYFGPENVYLGYIGTSNHRVSSKFSDRFKLERPATLIIPNVTGSDTGIYTIFVKTIEAKIVKSAVYLDVLGKLYL